MRLLQVHQVASAGLLHGSFMLLALLIPSHLVRWLDFVHFAPGIRPRSCRGITISLSAVRPVAKICDPTAVSHDVNPRSNDPKSQRGAHWFLFSRAIQVGSQEGEKPVLARVVQSWPVGRQKTRTSSRRELAVNLGSFAHSHTG